MTRYFVIYIGQLVLFGAVKSRRLRWAGHLAQTGKTRNAKRNLVGKFLGKFPFRKLRKRWESNIMMYLRKVDRMGGG